MCILVFGLKCPKGSDPLQYSEVEYPVPAFCEWLEQFKPGTIAGVVADSHRVIALLHQVGGELDAAEGEVQDLGQGLDDQGLCQPGDPFQEDVAPAQHGQEQVLQDLPLADDDVTDFLEELLAGSVEFLD